MAQLLQVRDAAQICSGSGSRFRAISSFRKPVQRIKCAANSTSDSSSSGSLREESLDEFLQEILAPGAGVSREERPPRLCTLRAFREGGAEALSGKVSSDTSSVLFKPLAANVQATAEAQSFETFSGRFAMVAFAVALGVEVVTGNSLFRGLEGRELGGIVAASGVGVVIMAVFAAAWGAKNRIGVTVTKGCQELVEYALTDILNAMFYDDDEEI